MPILENLAAKYNGKPCVAKVGPGGSGNYVKIAHNGIEQGMLSVLNESWELLFKCLHTDLDEISWILEKWNTEGELVSSPSATSCSTPADPSQKNTFLVRIGAEI